MKYAGLCLLMLVLILNAGCGGTLVNTHGDNLTWPRPTPAVSVDKTWVNNSPYSFFVGPENEDRQQILPGSRYTFHHKSAREKQWTITFPKQKGISEYLSDNDFTRVGVFPGEIIYVDEFFVHGLMQQPGYIINKEVYAFHVTDIRNNDYGILQPGESTDLCQAMPGVVTFYAKPVDARYQRYGVRKYVINIDDEPDDHVWTDNQGKQRLVGWYVLIEPRDLQFMR